MAQEHQHTGLKLFRSCSLKGKQQCSQASASLLGTPPSDIDHVREKGNTQMTGWLSALLGRKRGRGEPVKQRKDPTAPNVGDMCEVLQVLRMEENEERGSKEIVTLAERSLVEVTQVGKSSDRVKVACRGCSGWIDVKLNKQRTVMKRICMDRFALTGFEVGCQHKLCCNVTVRVNDRYDSAVEGEWKSGTLVQILEVSPPARAKLLANSTGREGWITLMNRNGQLSLATVDSEGIGTGAQEKAFLAAARAGDLQALIKAAEKYGGDKKFNPNCRDIRGKTALILASAFGNKEIVEHLITGVPGVVTSAVDDTQRTALHHATRGMQAGSSHDIVKVLLEARASVNECDATGCTPLMYAVSSGCQLSVTTLLLARANANVTDNEGRSPIEYARETAQEHIVPLLLDYRSKGNSSPAALEARPTDAAIERSPLLVSDSFPAVSSEQSPKAAPKKKAWSKSKAKTKSPMNQSGTSLGTSVGASPRAANAIDTIAEGQQFLPSPKASSASPRPVEEASSATPSSATAVEANLSPRSDAATPKKKSWNTKKK